MSLPSEDLQAILREQAELRLRLVALDRKIEAWQNAEVRRSVPSAGVDVGSVSANPTSTRDSSIPPPLPAMAASPSDPNFLRKEVPSIPKIDPVSSGVNVSDFLERPIPEKIQPESAPPPAPPSAILPERKSSLEFKLGTVWLVRIGIVILITGLVLLGNYAYHQIVPYIGPWGKLTALALAGGLLAGFGFRLEKQSENLRNYGRVLLAGGIAIFYYTTYAASFVTRLRVIESPLLGGILLLAVGAAVVWLAEKRQSQTVALTAILLSYYTSAINPLGSFSLYSNLLLTAAAVYFLLRHRWTALSFFSIIGTYGSFAFWQYHQSGPFFTGSINANDFWTGALFLAGYWILFTVAVFLSRAENFSAAKRTPFLTINNAAFFSLIALSLNRWQPDLVGRFYLGFSVVLLGLSWVAKRRQSSDLLLDGAYLVQGLGVLTLGLVTELTGYQLATALAVQSSLLLLGLNRRHGWIYEIGAALTSLGALGIVQWQQPEDRAEWIVRCTLIGLFILNSWICRHRKLPAPGPDLSWRSLGYGLLTFPLITSLLEKVGPLYPTQVTYCLTGFALLALSLLIRLPEMSLVGQLFIVISSISYCLNGSNGSLQLLAIICLSPVLMIHWCQRQKNGFYRMPGETLFSMLALAVMARCLYDSQPGESLVVWTAFMVMAILVYGIFTRAFILALGGQVFVFATALIYFWQTLVNTDPWLFPTASLAILIVHQILLDRGTERFPNAWHGPIRQLAQVFTPLLFAMIAAWGWAYMDVPGRMLFYVLFSAGLIAWAHLQKDRNPDRTSRLMFYAAISVIGALTIYTFQSIVFTAHSRTHGLDILSFSLLTTMHYVTKKSFHGTSYFSKSAQITLLVSIVLGLWLETNYAISGTEFPKTVAWALLATLFLGVGLAIRERGYRLGGLFLLALSVLRIATVDIWKLDRLYQILSFLVLGVLLLGIGFIYNKFAEKLREWL